MLWLLYCSAGILAGLAAGMFGVGGGTIIVPALIFGFSVQGMSADVLVHTAVGTSLAAIVAGIASSAYAHWRRGAMSLPLFYVLAPGMLLGVVCGGVLASYVSGEVLRVAVALLLGMVGLKMLFDWQPAQRNKVYGVGGMFTAGSTVGVVCAFTGVGGGGMTVPFLHWYGVRMHQAVATSAACGIVISFAGALSYMWSGWHIKSVDGAFYLGYVNLAAAMCIAVFSMLFAPLGVNIVHRVSERKLRIGFAWFLICGSVFTVIKWG